MSLKRSLTLSLLLLAAISASPPAETATTESLDPAAWGDDHVELGFPEYITGDECLFCHRTIGPQWLENAHQSTIRPATRNEPSLRALLAESTDESLADAVRYLLGTRRQTRFLRRGERYGQLEVLTATYSPGSESLDLSDSVTWESKLFGDKCAGCHTTAVDSRRKAFSSLSIDCFSCHGDVRLTHTDRGGEVHLSSERQDSRTVISICGQCHLRGGTSRDSGLPYANTFVAGDNLFRDFQVDLSAEAIGQRTPSEQHIFQNARDVVISGQLEVSCVSCHTVHAGSSEKHQALVQRTLCGTCHEPELTGLKSAYLESAGAKAHSRVCGYGN